MPLHLPAQLRIARHYVGRLKSAVPGVFTPQKLTNVHISVVSPFRKELAISTPVLRKVNSPDKVSRLVVEPSLQLGSRELVAMLFYL